MCLLAQPCCLTASPSPSKPLAYTVLKTSVAATATAEHLVADDATSTVGHVAMNCVAETVLVPSPMSSPSSEPHSLPSSSSLFVEVVDAIAAEEAAAAAARQKLADDELKEVLLEQTRKAAAAHAALIAEAARIEAQLKETQRIAAQRKTEEEATKKAERV